MTRLRQPLVGLGVLAAAVAVGVYLLFGGSSIPSQSLGFHGTLPPIAPTPDASTGSTFLTGCDPKPVVPGGGPYLTCGSAISTAVATLPAGHAPIESAAFHYDCPVGADCAVWLFGVVDISFVDTTPPATVHVVLGSDGHVSIAPAITPHSSGPTT